jgi:hypothetical protein
MLRLLVFVIPIAISIYALIDAITTPKTEVRSLPKIVWIIAILMLWIGGAVLWFFLGRPKRGESSYADQKLKTYRPQGPDDDPEFLNKLR